MCLTGVRRCDPSPLICTVLDVIPLAIPSIAPDSQPALYEFGGRQCARRGAYSNDLQAAKEDITRYIGVPAERITVTHLASTRSSTGTGAKRDQAVRAKYGLDDVDDFVLYLGSYNVHKNVRLLLAAYTTWHRDTGCALVLAGAPGHWGTPHFPDLPATSRTMGWRMLCAGSAGRRSDKPSLYVWRAYSLSQPLRGLRVGTTGSDGSGTPVVACEASSIRKW